MKTAIMILMLTACGTDVSIMKREDNPPATDTSSVDTNNSQPSEPDTVDSSNPTMEGIGGYFQYKLQQIACPPCFGIQQEISITVEAEFHEPITDQHTEWLLVPGECTANLTITNPSENIIDVGQSIIVESPFRSFYLSPRGDGTYYNNSLYETQYDRDAIHTISSDTIGNIAQFTSFHGFDYIEPASMLYIDPSYAFAAPISSGGAYFSWGPYGSDSLFFITLDIYSSNGAALLGSVTCSSLDDGSMIIPGQYLSNYSPGSLVAIYLNRHKVDLSPMAPLESYLESHMQWEVVGTGYLQ